LRPTDTRHRTESFRCQQDLVADSGVYRIQRHHRIAPRRIVEVERLNQQDLAPFMARMLLRSNDLANDSRD
jgi:hypothetical protein